MAKIGNSKIKKTVKLELSLSGGGFRATLFHLGVIAALRDCGALAHLGRMAAVSGGSIMAAHLALNWARYSSRNNGDFKKVAHELIRFTRKDLRGRILRRWLGGTPVRLGLRLLQLLRIQRLNRRLADAIQRGIENRTPIGLLNRYLDAFFCHASLKDLGSNGEAPEVSILATNLNTHGLTCFDRNGYRADLADKPSLPGPLSVGFGVAASSAFPGFFPPLAVPGSGKDVSTYLSDGGIYDNLGISFFLQAGADDRNDDDRYLLVSDASGVSNPLSNEKISTALFTSIRAVDILMGRLRELGEKFLNTTRCAVVRISDEVGPSEVPNPVMSGLQASLSRLRTDLDGFNWTEIEALVRHGYSVCRKTLSNDPRARGLGISAESFTDDLSWLGTSRLVSPKKPRATFSRLNGGAARKYIFTSSLVRDPMTYCYAICYGWLFKEAADLITVISYQGPTLQAFDGFADKLLKEVSSVYILLSQGWGWLTPPVQRGMEWVRSFF